MRIPLVALALLLLAGCKRGPELVGKWTANAGDKSIEIEFGADNAYTIATSRMKAKGEYKRDGDKLALTPKDVELPGLPPGTAERAKAMPAFGRTTNTTIQFTGEDELSISGLPGTLKSAANTTNDPKKVSTAKVSGAVEATVPRPAITLRRVKS